MLALPVISKVDPSGLLEHPAEAIISSLKASISEYRAAHPSAHFFMGVDTADYHMLRAYLGLKPKGPDGGYELMRIDGVSLLETHPIDMSDGTWTIETLGQISTAT